MEETSVIAVSESDEKSLNETQNIDAIDDTSHLEHQGSFSTADGNEDNNDGGAVDEEPAPDTGNE